MESVWLHLENMVKRKWLPFFLIISRFIPARHWRCYVLDFICGQNCKKEKQMKTIINYPRKMLVYVVWTYKHFYQCSRWQLTPKRQKYKCVWILLLDLFLFCGIVLCSRERDSMTTLENFYFGNINPSEYKQSGNSKVAWWTSIHTHNRTAKGEDWADWKLPAFADCSLWEGRLHRGFQDWR